MVNSVGTTSTVGRLPGSNHMGFVNRAYVDATSQLQCHQSMLFLSVTYMLNTAGYQVLKQN